jgi:hypothetical protein
MNAGVLGEERHNRLELNMCCVPMKQIVTGKKRGALDFNFLGAPFRGFLFCLKCINR